VTWVPGSLQIVLLNADHDRTAFACGVEALDRYIREQAAQDMRRGTARVFVLTTIDRPDRLLGYYTLSAASIVAQELPAGIAKRLPKYPIPAALIGRLAVAHNVARQGLGRLLLADAIKKAMLAGELVAITAVVVDPIDDTARDFYMDFGFQSLLGPQQRMFLTLPPRV